MKFMYVPCLDDAETIADVLMESLEEYKIDHKLSSLVLNNCSTNNSLIDLIKEKLPCNSFLLGGSLLHM